MITPQSKRSARQEKLEDYRIIRLLGKGAYSDVYLAQNTNTQRETAMKTIEKAFIEKQHKEHQVYIERDVLLQIHHPGIIQLVSTFQTTDKLYFCLEYAQRGDLSTYAKENGPLTFEQVQFCTAEILLALEFIHQNGIVHRDVKPENLLLTSDFHLKLTDFGTAFIFDESKLSAERAARIKAVRERFHRSSSPEGNEQVDIVLDLCRRSSFVGTSEYLCPELIDHNLCGPQADLWALGCIIIKLFTGHTPFEDELEYNVFQKITTADPLFPKEAPKQAIDFMKILLHKDPVHRFGAKFDKSNYNYDGLKQHPFFDGMEWNQVWTQPSPLVRIPVVQRSTKKTMTSVQSSFTESTFSQSPEGGLSGYFTIRGTVEKEGGFLFTSFTPRILTLSVYKNMPSLCYVNPQKGNTKVVIQLNQSSQCRLLDKGRFVIEDKYRKKFIFKEKEHPARFWVEEINKIINNF